MKNIYEQLTEIIDKIEDYNKRNRVGIISDSIVGIGAVSTDEKNNTLITMNLNDVIEISVDIEDRL